MDGIPAEAHAEAWRLMDEAEAELDLDYLAEGVDDGN